MNGEARDSSWERRKLALQLHHKYELFFLSLALLLAGLSVYTAHPSETLWRVLVEIAGWCFLLLSGLIGLWRIGRQWRHMPAAEPPAAELMWDVVDEFAYLQYGDFVVGLVLVVLSRAAFLLGH